MPQTLPRADAARHLSLLTSDSSAGGGGAYRVQADQEAALAARSEELHEGQARTAALNERARIAREIHDVLAHSLGALGVQIELARAVLTDQHDEARAAEFLDPARRMTSDGLASPARCRLTPGWP
jgi:signal transduction histidine kinase